MDFINLEKNTLVMTKEPLAGSNISILLRLLIQNRFKVDPRYIPRMLYSLALSSMMTPLRIKESIQFDKAIKETTIRNDPIFILGHWRSGTTYLHNVLSQDENFGYFSTFHTSLPGVFLGSEHLLRPLVASSIPDKRPMDDVTMGIDSPQEDEFALAAFSQFSGNHGLCFTRNADFYNRYVFMENVSKKEVDEWKKVYLYLLKKETLYRNGKRLVLKNPANTARVKLLLEMFPDAKFIHIHRNPYYLYLSMMKLLFSIVPYFCVQKPPVVDEVEKRVLQVYRRMYEKYFKEKKSVLRGNLVEVKYEDFIQKPLEGVKKIYSELNLKGFKKSENAFKKYIASQAHIKIQKYEIDKTLKEKVYKKWKFAFKEFEYSK